MTIADLLWKWSQGLESKLTRLLGLATGTWAIVDAANILPQPYAKWSGVILGVLIFWRGQSTSDTYQLAKTIVSNNPTEPLKPASKEIPR